MKLKYLLIVLLMVFVSCNEEEPVIIEDITTTLFVYNAVNQYPVEIYQKFSNESYDLIDQTFYSNSLNASDEYINYTTDITCEVNYDYVSVNVRYYIPNELIKDTKEELNRYLEHYSLEDYWIEYINEEQSNIWTLIELEDNYTLYIDSE